VDICKIASRVAVAQVDVDYLKGEILKGVEAMAGGRGDWASDDDQWYFSPTDDGVIAVSYAEDGTETSVVFRLVPDPPVQS